MVEENIKEKVAEEKVYSLVEVPTGSALAFKTPQGKVLSTEELLVEMANKLEEVTKFLAVKE